VSTVPLPHEQVYVRLGSSAIHGIGVIAVRRIAEGTNIFANDRVELVWIDARVLKDPHLSEADRAFYRDFAIVVDGLAGCPVNFHNLTPGWYLNEAPEGALPNVRIDAELNYFAACDIEPGEELTIRYPDLLSAARAFIASSKDVELRKGEYRGV